MAIRDYVPKRDKMVNRQVKMPESLLKEVHEVVYSMRAAHFRFWLIIQQVYGLLMPEIGRSIRLHTAA